MNKVWLQTDKWARTTYTLKKNEVYKSGKEAYKWAREASYEQDIFFYKLGEEAAKLLWPRGISDKQMKREMTKEIGEMSKASVTMRKRCIK